MTLASCAPLRAPFVYFGGKRRVASLIWERFGDVYNFIDPFAGSLAVLLARPHPPRIETVNDLDAYLTNFWRSVQADPEGVAEWADWPVSELDLHARHRWLVEQGWPRIEDLRSDPAHYDVQVAGWWVWGISAWIGSGWCTRPEWKARPDLGEGGQGIHVALDDKRPSLGRGGRGVHNTRKLPHVGDAGPGLHRPLPEQLPHVGNTGRGGHRAPCHQLPRLSWAGQGVHQAANRGTCAERRAWLVALMQALCDRLRHVRICCGDWTRVLGPSVTTKNGLTAVLLDPPYSHAERHDALYSTESDVAADVRAWAIANGDDPLLRIALCSYGEDPCPPDWTRVTWKAAGGYGSQGQGRGRDNAHREAIDFSPHCLQPHRPRQLSLLDTP